MARAATDEQSDLRRRARRRLIGAMALVTVIAVVLPWVLEREPRQGDQEVSIQIPSPDSSTFKSPVATGKMVEPKAAQAEDSDAPSAARPAPEVKPAESKPAESAPVTRSDPLKLEQDKVLAPPVPKSVAPKGVAKEGASPAAKKKPEHGANGRQYVVQVTALADAEKAAVIQQDLAGKGLKVYTEVVKTASGDVTRVRIGPFPGKEAAEREKAKLKTQGIDGNVVPR